jgi:hypothetical protein
VGAACSVSEIDAQTVAKLGAPHVDAQNPRVVTGKIQHSRIVGRHVLKDRAWIVDASLILIDPMGRSAMKDKVRAGDGVRLVPAIPSYLKPFAPKPILPLGYRNLGIGGLGQLPQKFHGVDTRNLCEYGHTTVTSTSLSE